MADGARDSFRRFSGAWAALAALVVALALSVAMLPHLERLFVDEVRERNEAALRLAVEGLSGTLSRFEAFPALIAERPALAELLERPQDEALRVRVSAQFSEDTRALGASDVYLMDRTGLTIAASSYLKDRSFVGRSFDYRPYFADAVKGGLGRFFALGTTSRERGYYYAAPVLRGDEVLGVVAVKFTVEEFEAAWQGGENDLLVSDLDNIVFMSNRPDWHFRTLQPLDREARARIERDRQYPLERLEPLDHVTSSRWGGEVIDIAGAPSPFLVSRLPIPEAGWQVHVLTPVAPALAQARVALLAVLLALLVLAMVGLVIRQRRLRLLDRIETQRTQQDVLERRVAERTGDLNEANQQLTLEVQERRATETRLKTTQQELIQAGKLAALGQMSAALSHEFNQPLAAIKSYSDNAATFLERGRLPETGENLQRISRLVDRMAEISQHLRSFARRPKDQTGPVPLAAALDDALALVDMRLRQQNAVVARDIPEGEVWVTGGRVRLVQVIVNLLTNALDAMTGMTDPRIEISLSQDASDAVLRVRDHGPGLAGDAMGQAFDPFFTTKDPGKGLGLGLSISYNIVRDFDGRLEVANHPEGGAVFTLSLPRAQSVQEAV